MKRFFQQLKIGIRSYRHALNFIANHRLQYFFLYPLILLFLLFGSSLSASAYVTHFSEQYLHAHLLSNTDTWYYSLLNGVVFSLIAIILKIVFLFIFAYVSGFIIMIVLSPVFSQLSERVAHVNRGTTYSFNFRQMLKDVVRGLVLSLKNILIELFFMLLALVISFIPLVGIFSPLLLFFVSAYFYGFAFMDYTNEREKRSVNESSRFVRQNKGLAVGIGFIYALFLLIPVFGSLISGFVAIVGVVAATLAMQNLDLQ